MCCRPWVREHVFQIFLLGSVHVAASFRNRFPLITARTRIIHLQVVKTSWLWNPEIFLSLIFFLLEKKMGGPESQRKFWFFLVCGLDWNKRMLPWLSKAPSPHCWAPGAAHGRSHLGILGKVSLHTPEARCSVQLGKRGFSMVSPWKPSLPQGSESWFVSCGCFTHSCF